MAGLPGPLHPRSREWMDAFRRHQADLERRQAAGIEPDRFVGRPGFAESLIPVWGSSREAIADFQEGDYVGAGINGAAAVSDLFLAGTAGKGVAKVISKAAGYAGKEAAEHGRAEVFKAGVGQLRKDLDLLSKPTRRGTPPWNYERVRQRMKNYDLVGTGEELHHWAAPQNGWGKGVPNVIKNNPLNLNPMPKQAHQLTHNNLPSQGLAKYGPLQRYGAATPAWAKSGTVGAGAHAAGAVKRQTDERR